MRMRIGFDATVLGAQTRYTCGGEYAYHLLRHLGRMDDGNEYFLYGWPGDGGGAAPHRLVHLRRDGATDPQHISSGAPRRWRAATGMVAIECWSGISEASDIADSEEYGCQYIEITRRYSDRFKALVAAEDR